MKLRIILVWVLILISFGMIYGQKQLKPSVLEAIEPTVSVTFVDLPTGIKIRGFETPLYPSGYWFGGRSVKVFVTIKNSKVFRATAVSGNPILRPGCEKAAKKIKFKTDFKQASLIVRYDY